MISSSSSCTDLSKIKEKRCAFLLNYNMRFENVAHLRINGIALGFSVFENSVEGLSLLVNGSKAVTNPFSGLEIFGLTGLLQLQFKVPVRGRSQIEIVGSFSSPPDGVLACCRDRGSQLPRALELLRNQGLNVFKFIIFG